MGPSTTTTAATVTTTTATTASTPLDVTQTKPKHEDFTATASPEILASSRSSETTITIGVMGGLIAILLLTTVLLSVTVLRLIHQRKLKSITTNSNPAYDGMWS